MKRNERMNGICVLGALYLDFSFVVRYWDSGQLHEEGQLFYCSIVSRDPWILDSYAL